jgi:hypothetical protein
MPVGVNAYIPLATVTLGSSASSVTFSSIPATYRDLILVLNGSLSSTANILTRLNGDTGSNYLQVVMQGRGSGPVSQSGTWDVLYPVYNELDLNTRFLTTIQFMDYAATDKHKSILIRSNFNSVSEQRTEAHANRWASTSALTTIAFTLTAGNYNAGSTFNLYGIAS